MLDHKPFSFKRKLLLSVTAGLLLSFLTFSAGEILTRIFWRSKPTFIRDERNLSYRYDQELGWFPIENSTKQFKDTREITASHNSDGFRDIDHGPKQKKRIAFIGDSYVWGYDVEDKERFTERIKQYMPDWEVFNMGVSGYGNDQEFLLLQKYFSKYKPDIVFLVFCENDWSENSSFSAHQGYYKPYFVLEEDKLVPKGIPVPKSLNYYRLEMPWLCKSELIQLLIAQYLYWKEPKTVFADPTFKLLAEIKKYSEAHGAKFMMSFIFDKRQDEKSNFCRSQGIEHLFLGDNAMYTTGGWHWTPIGNDSVAAKTFRFLQPHLK